MPPSTLYSFGPFELDARARRLNRAGEYVVITDQQIGVLLHLLANAGNIVTKAAIFDAVWGDVVVTDNTLEKVVSELRRVLGDDSNGRPYLENVRGRGYRFIAALTRSVARESDEALEAMLEPHRAWIEGRAALETLERDRITSARAAFETVLAGLPEHASAHIGLANACMMQFEMTRADVSPDRAALALAVEHAREACRLDPDSGEAWATLGFVLERVGRRVDAIASATRAVAIDAGNWRHYFRLSSVSWGDARLTAAHRTIALLPGFPLAHWMAATVHVARQSLGEADRELAAGILSQQRTAVSRFNSVALYWLSGLIAFARGDTPRALEAFEQELSLETSGHLYARECAANTWYAIGALHWRSGRLDDARRACNEALHRVAAHPMARTLAEAIDQSPRKKMTTSDVGIDPSGRPEVVIGQACRLVLAGDIDRAAALVERALVVAPPGNFGWLLPVEPILGIALNPAPWTTVLARLRNRSA